MRWSVALAVLVCGGCQGVLSIEAPSEDADGERMDASRPPPSDGSVGQDGAAASPSDGAARSDAATSDAGGNGYDAGPCVTSGLAESLTVIDVPGVSASPPLFAAATSAGGAVAAFHAGSTAALQRLSGDGAVVGDAILIEGNGLWGFDASSDAYGAIVSRGSDALYLDVVNADGSPRFSNRLLGEVPHDVTENEWFGTSIRYGRLAFTGSEWAPYYTVNRLWADGVAHYGDQLRLFAQDGSPVRTVWDWGCSHSMEVRIAHHGTILGPVCASDCYPSKGVHFHHRSAQLYTDEDGANCAGRYATTLGGVVPMDDGFWISFTATDGRDSHDVGLIHVGNDRRPGPLSWLTEDAVNDGSVHAVRFGAGFVVAWVAGGTERIARFDASGALVEGPVDLDGAGLAAASDFFVFENGDAGWVTSNRGSLALARLRACD